MTYRPELTCRQWSEMTHNEHICEMAMAQEKFVYPDDTGVFGTKWICFSEKCGHTNWITLVHGEHPLQRLECVSCGHVMCPGCIPPCILKAVPSDNIGDIFQFVFRYRGREPNYFELCSFGLTHRATASRLHGSIKGSTTVIFWNSSQYCPCGCLVDCTWRGFNIRLNKDSASPKRSKSTPLNHFIA